MKSSFFRLIPTLCLVLAATVPCVSTAGSGDIETAIKNSFNYRMVLQSHVDVRVDGRVAILSGRAEDETSKTLAAETALLHAGIDRVINDIEVKPWLTEFSDGWMARHIHLRLLVKSGVNPETTKVRVRDGVATLTGTAVNRSQKHLTARFASEVVGVKEVVNHLKYSSEPAARRFWDGPIDDASITSQLRLIIRATPEVNSPALAYDTLDGAITITGVARSQAEKDLITQLAHEVRGCVAVTNLLTVPSESITAHAEPTPDET